ncbi:hypothetical protein G6F57_022621 [Rhizopus arrhizus]|nr:hypothetical protein G6F57_022621 [Rhizopus arrhizus]
MALGQLAPGDAPRPPVVLPRIRRLVMPGAPRHLQVLQQLELVRMDKHGRALPPGSPSGPLPASADNRSSQNRRTTSR